MSATAIVTMTLILGFVWGGFLFIVGRAARAERNKRHPDSGPGSGVSVPPPGVSVPPPGGSGPA